MSCEVKRNQSRTSSTICLAGHLCLKRSHVGGSVFHRRSLVRGQSPCGRTDRGSFVPVAVSSALCFCDLWRRSQHRHNNVSDKTKTHRKSRVSQSQRFVSGEPGLLPSGHLSYKGFNKWKGNSSDSLGRFP